MLRHAAAAILLAGVSAPVLAHGTQIFLVRDADDKLVGIPIDVTVPLRLDIELPGYDGVFSDVPVFEEGFFNIPPEYFPMWADALVGIEIISIDTGLIIHSPDFTEQIDAPGEQYIFPPTGFHFHQDTWWQVDPTAEGFVELPEYSVTFKLIDLTGIHSESDPITLYFAEPGCVGDFTGSSDPNNPLYGVPDGTIDADDFFVFLDYFSEGNLRADLTTSSDPNHPFYGIPDGELTSDDFFYFLDRFVIGCD